MAFGNDRPTPARSAPLTISEEQLVCLLQDARRSPRRCIEVEPAGAIGQEIACCYSITEIGRPSLAHRVSKTYTRRGQEALGKRRITPSPQPIPSEASSGPQSRTNPGQECRQWVLIDLEGQTLETFDEEVAVLEYVDGERLQGPHSDTIHVHFPVNVDPAVIANLVAKRVSDRTRRARL